MPIETRTTEINGRAWQCTQFSGTKSVDVLHTLAFVLGPAMGSLAKGFDRADPLSSQVNVEGAVTLLLDRVGDAQKLQSTLNKLLANTRVDNVPMSPGVFDDVFAGVGILDLGPVLRFVITANYGDFSQAASIIKRFAATVRPPDNSPDGLAKS